MRIEIFSYNSFTAALGYGPADLAGYVLESAAMAPPTVRWLTDNQAPLTIGYQHFIPEEQASGSEFLRRRRQ